MVKALVSAVVGFFIATASAMAQSCGNLPIMLTNGTTASAADVMNDLNHLRTCINNLTVLPVGPTGRLTLITGTPVMTADATGTVIYYTPYAGARVQIYDGVAFVPFAFAQLTATTTTTNQVANGVYDLFVFSNSGTVTLGFGPAWTSATSRGTGAGTTQLQLTQGLWTNQQTITLTNGATAYSPKAPGLATYVGTVAITAAAGQMAMQFKPSPAVGGNNTWLGVWNAYNRVTVRSRSAENQNFWDYPTQTYRAVNGSNNNRINWVDGLQQSQIIAQYNQIAGLSNAGAYGAVAWDQTTTPNGSLAISQNFNASSVVVNTFARDTNTLLGRHYVQALERAQSGTPRFYGFGEGSSVLEVELEM